MIHVVLEVLLLTDNLFTSKWNWMGWLNDCLNDLFFPLKHSSRFFVLHPILQPTLQRVGSISYFSCIMKLFLEKKLKIVNEYSVAVWAIHFILPYFYDGFTVSLNSYCIRQWWRHLPVILIEHHLLRTMEN